MQCVTIAELALAVSGLESSPGLGRYKEASLQTLHLGADLLSASDIAAVNRTATNPKENPYVPAL
ncbi:hypothetical protein HDU98_005581, partial [Podochytrium sp. JEL0797]